MNDGESNFDAIGNGMSKVKPMLQITKILEFGVCVTGRAKNILAT